MMSPGKIFVGVPTINQLNHLQHAIHPVIQADCEAVVINNSVSSRYSSDLQELCAKSRVSILSKHRNLGVAASWNWIIREGISRGYDYILIGSDDTHMGDRTIEAIKNLETHDNELLWHFEGWNLFLLHKKLIDVVGWFDENYFPAYYEDIDYSYRCDVVCRAVERVCVAAHDEMVPRHVYKQLSVRINPDIEAQHFVSQSSQYNFIFKRYINISRRLNRQYYIQKWGGDVGEEMFVTPFNMAQEASYWPKPRSLWLPARLFALLTGV
jgi:hypothetical protein